MFLSSPQQGAHGGGVILVGYILFVIVVFNFIKLSVKFDDVNYVVKV